jgi:hypothetical protein
MHDCIGTVCSMDGGRGHHPDFERGGAGEPGAGVHATPRRPFFWLVPQAPVAHGLAQVPGVGIGSDMPLTVRKHGVLQDLVVVANHHPRKRCARVMVRDGHGQYRFGKLPERVSQNAWQG